MSGSGARASPAWAGTLAQRGSAVLLNTYARHPVELVSGCGTRVIDSDGREHLDFLSGLAVSALGHAHPAVVRTLREAASGLLHVSNLYWTEPMVRLAERLVGVSGMERVFFCNSGAEAVEAALKLARKARPGRPRTLCFERSFHGRTTGALAITAQESYQRPFRPLLPGASALPFGDFEAVERSVREDVAAVFVEVVQGEGGVRPAPDGWLRHLAACCERAGALLVADEVQTGVGRTGSFYAFEQDGILPDAVTSAKALAAGLPMGALLVRGEAAGALAPGDHGSTFGGGPFVAAVASAVVDEILADGFLEEVLRKGESLHAGLARLTERHGGAAAVRGRGLLQGLVLEGLASPELVAALRERGVLAAPAGPDVLRLAPPLVVTEEEIDEALSRADDALASLGNARRTAAPGRSEAKCRVGD